MQFHFRSPAFLLAAMLILALGASAGVLYVAASQPAVTGPLAMRAGDLPVVGPHEVVGLVTPAQGDRADNGGETAIADWIAKNPALGILFEPLDFIEDPDMLPSYAAGARFYERQGLIRALLDESRVQLVLKSAAGGLMLEERAVAPMRGIDTLPAAFWMQIGAGLLVIVIAAVFLALRPGSAAVRCFAFAGLGITGAAYTAAVYSSRQLGMETALISTLSVFNHIFTVSFGIGMIALFSLYPVRIARLRRTALPAAILSYGSLVLFQFRLAPHDMVMLQNVVALLLLAILVLVFAQYRATRGRPADRAALVWLGLSVVVGATAFVALVIIPAALGRPGIVSQAFGFILLGLIYVGIAFAVARYRLFDIGRWSWRVVLYSGMLVSILVLDVAFIVGLQASEQASLAFASIIMLALYLPLRDLVQDRLFSTSRQSLPDLYRQAVASAYKFTPAARQAAWQQLLEEAFRPGHVAVAATGPSGIGVRNEGIEMVLPAYPWSEPLSLGFAAQGRRLFGTQDVKLIEELADIAASAHADRLSYEKGAEEERQRIARDLHDDVGSTLLSGLHAVDEGRRQETLVEALSDIRRIAHDLAGRELSMEQFIAQLRHDSRQRAQAQGRDFDWPLGSADDDLTVLPYRFHHNLSAMLRESMSNALKHGAGAIAVTAGTAQGRLAVTVSNAASTAAPVGDQAGGGIGLVNLATRAAALGGTASSGFRDGRFSVVIDLPLPGGTG